MSAISDFRKVWEQKFPGSELPAAWEEDVKTNLRKHKQRVLELQQELETEQTYVRFLESLLEDVDKRKQGSASPGHKTAPGATNGRSRTQTEDIEDAIEDTLAFSSTAQARTGWNKPIQRSASLEVSDEDFYAEAEKGVKQEEESPNQGQSEDEESREAEGDKNKDHFVTVIEVNGAEKEKLAAAASSQAEQQQSKEDDDRLKKVPPRPPPKFVRKNTSEASSSTPTSSLSQDSQGSSPSEADDKLSGGLPTGKPTARTKPDRPIVFDSKRNSTGSVPEPKSSVCVSPGNANYANVLVDRSSESKSSSKHGAGPKRFEGCKLPLPDGNSSAGVSAEQESLVGKRYRGKDQSSEKISTNQEPKEAAPVVSVRSKIKDIMNKMESSHKTPPVQKPSKPGELMRRPNSFRHQNSPAIYSDAADSIVCDYIDPCDIDMDEPGGEQFYDIPPVEDDVPQKVPNSRRGSDQGKKKKPPAAMTSVPKQEVEMEPMYDTVAPDQEDYVNTRDEQLSDMKANSLRKLAKIKDIVDNGVARSNDGSTIKSQASVISGHSIGTTNSSGTPSETEGLTGSGSPLPEADGTHKSSNYVNIDYFLHKSKRKDSRASAESEDDESPLSRAISMDDTDRVDSDTVSSSIDMFDMDSGSMGSRSTEALTMTAEELEQYAVFRCMVNKVIDLETSYMEYLNVMLMYMKALKATLKTSKPVLSTDDFNIIFCKVPDLHSLHDEFLSGLQQQNTNVGKHFETLAQKVGVYADFLQNYSRAVDTVRKCSQNNPDFAAMTRSIKPRSANNKNQEVSLETLLYSPVSRVQKNIEIIEDLLRCLPENHPDHKSLKNASKNFQTFLTDFKMIQPEQLFHGHDRNPRHLVKNSFIVELSEGNRKLRHLFLFNDVLVCAKYKASKGEKFTFELKWYIPVHDCTIIEETIEPRESTPINLVALRSQASTVRDNIKRQTSRDDPKKAKAEKHRKKLAELEAQLVLASPNLVFKLKGNGRAYTFFLSSEYERSQWVEAIETLKAGQLPTPGQLSMHELQAWLTSCRKHLKTNMGSYLLRSGRDENLLVGDFHILIGQLTGIQRAADLYICLEVDSYGHFFRKAKTKMVCESTAPNWNQDFVIELEGSQNLRILLYEDHPRNGTLIRAKTTIELNRSWLTTIMSERKIELQDYTLTVTTKFVPCEMTIRRVPTAKPSGLYGAKIWQVCNREKRDVPFIITSCVREVERRGINEVGIYRVSGSASDVSKLKKAFETNSYEAEQLLKEVDIHSVTGALKLYMRELPEALFTDALYPKFFEAFNFPDPEKKRKDLMSLFSTLPYPNQPIIMFLLDHMTAINSHENHNKMSLHNLATVFGPTLLRPGLKNDSSIDSLAAGTVDVMAQAGILYFFLSRRANGEPVCN